MSPIWRAARGATRRGRRERKRLNRRRFSAPAPRPPGSSGAPPRPAPRASAGPRDGRARSRIMSNTRPGHIARGHQTVLIGASKTVTNEAESARNDSFWSRRRARGAEGPRIVPTSPWRRFAALRRGRFRRPGLDGGAWVMAWFGSGARIRHFETGPPDATTPCKMQDATPKPTPSPDPVPASWHGMTKAVRLDIGASLQR